ncbi:MAG: hypothetical protein R3330_19860, partial [Saprospiraceae bacterium]|nr:hypothetical protein [Saprospiraceae bacterium]
MYRLNEELLPVNTYRQRLRGADNPADIVAFDLFADTVLMLAGSNNYLIATSDDVPRSQSMRLALISDPVRDIEVVDRTIYVATESEGGIRYATLGKLVEEYQLLPESEGHSVYCLDYSPDHDLLAAGFRDNRIVLYRHTTSDGIPHIDTVLEDHNDKVLAVAFSASGKYLASGGADNKLYIWRREGGRWQPGAGFDTHDNDIVDLAFSGDSLLLTASTDRTVRLYRDSLDKFWRIPSMISHNTPVTAVTFMPTAAGLQAISGDRNGVIRKWDIASFDSLMRARTFDGLVREQAAFDAMKDLKGTSWRLVSRVSGVPEKLVFGQYVFESDCSWT